MTGVQTCALPICPRDIPPQARQIFDFINRMSGGRAPMPGMMQGNPIFGILNSILRSQGGGQFQFPFGDTRDTTAGTDDTTRPLTPATPTHGDDISTSPAARKADRLAPGGAAGGGAAPAVTPVPATPAPTAPRAAASAAPASAPGGGAASGVPAGPAPGSEIAPSDPSESFHGEPTGAGHPFRWPSWLGGSSSADPDGGTPDVSAARPLLGPAYHAAVAPTIPHEEQVTSSIHERPVITNTEASAAAYGARSYTNVPDRVLHGARRAAMLGGPGAVFAFMRKEGHPRNGNWCGEFAAAVMSSEGLPVPRHPEVASNWRNWGTPTPRPHAGDVAVRRGTPTGSTGSHVMMVERVFPDGSAIVIGGNQRHGIRQHVSARYMHMFDFRTWPNPHGPSRYATIQ